MFNAVVCVTWLKAKRQGEVHSRIGMVLRTVYKEPEGMESYCVFHLCF